MNGLELVFSFKSRATINARLSFIREFSEAHQTCHMFLHDGGRPEEEKIHIFITKKKGYRPLSEADKIDILLWLRSQDLIHQDPPKIIGPDLSAAKRR